MTREALHVGRRSLGREHFAYYRACLEGLHAEAQWDRYLSLEGDYSEETGRAVMGWIRAELHALCARERPELLGLMRRDPRRMRTVKVPSLEEMADRLGVDLDFYTEAELVDVWRDQFTKPGRRSADARSADERRVALARRLRLALLDLENTYCKVPRNEDHVRQWLSEGLCERLFRAGVSVLGDLVSLRQTGGARWWDRVERLGEVGGRRLQGWLDVHFVDTGDEPLVLPFVCGSDLDQVEHSIEVSLPSPVPGESAAALPQSPSALIANTPDPQAQDEAEPPAYVGGNPGSAASIESPSAEAALRWAVSAADEQCVEAWIRLQTSTPASARAYMREAQRFLLWLGHVRRRQGLAQATSEDCSLYREWLGQVGRLADDDFASRWGHRMGDWVQDAKTGKGGPWRPFKGALSERSQMHAMTILRGLASYRLEEGMDKANPWRRVARKPATQQDLDAAGDAKGPGESGAAGYTGKSLPPQAAKYLVEQARQAPGILGKRAAVAVWLGIGCGLRASEMCSLNVQNIGERFPGRWQARVMGKGRKPRDVDLPTGAVAAIADYMDACGIDRTTLILLMASRGEKDSSGATIMTPLLRSHSRRTSKNAEPRLGYRGLHAQLEQLLAQCAKNLELDPATAEDAGRFRAATIHWMRHTFGTEAYKATKDIVRVQHLMGHASINTTRGYVGEHADAGRIVAAVMESILVEQRGLAPLEASGTEG